MESQKVRPPYQPNALKKKKGVKARNIILAAILGISILGVLAVAAIPEFRTEVIKALDMEKKPTVPSYLPSRFTDLRLRMSETRIRSMFSGLKPFRVNPLLRLLEHSDYDPEVQSTSRLSVEIDDERFSEIEFHFFEEKLGFIKFIVREGNCSEAYVRGMADALSKKTGRGFMIKDNGGYGQAREYFEGDALVSVNGIENRCYYTLTDPNWMDWKKKEKVDL